MVKLLTLQVLSSFIVFLITRVTRPPLLTMNKERLGVYLFSHFLFPYFAGEFDTNLIENTLLKIKFKVFHLKHKQRINHERMNAVIFTLRCSDLYVNVKWKQKFCPENNLHSKYFHCSFVFLFLIIESNELHVSSMVYHIADCWY